MEFDEQLTGWFPENKPRECAVTARYDCGADWEDPTKAFVETHGVPSTVRS